MKKYVICIAIMAVAVFFLSDKFVKKEDQVRHESELKTYVINATPSEIPYEPLNFGRQKSMWFTYMDYSSILMDKSEDEFRNEISERFKKASTLGINTVYVQVRSFCDAYYSSELFPKGKYYTDTSYDPLEIMLSQAHALGMSFHAWINPLRCCKTDEVENLDGKYEFVKWYSSEENKKYISVVNDRLYLNPAYDDVRRYICDGIKEIIEKYNVDGIHIDDYFYPDTAESFDKEAFVQSGNSDLAEWRRSNINMMVSSMYRTIKSVNSHVLFGISPQGNRKINFENQYADTDKWISEGGYCDYIVPQLYYGYDNESCPFEKIVDEWVSVKSDKVKLIAGLCTYKLGSEDKWAGKGINEWIDNNDITFRQTRDCAADPDIDGVAIYSFSSTFEDEISSDIMLNGQVQEIREVLEEYS